MISLRSLLAAAPLLALAVAQNIAFTSTPALVEAGESYNITWGGGDDTGVTVTLRRGNPQDLTTIDTIADNVIANYYVWEAPESLESGDDYALQITQGQSDINYSGLFSVEGGSSSSSTPTVTGGASDNRTTSTAPGNSTMSMTSMASASGTGTAMSRNSTFSTAALTSSSSSASKSSSNTATFGDMTSTGSSSSQTASSSADATSAPSNDAPTRTGSSAALILGIVAAVMLH
ncbi:hypothetical protein LTR70_003985 [Exophiala xenobiotica]|uniref:Yeast cell wall synthesis Kre9/Knh1-like N-terminal domain-containing protein n=1 Tax=Lithohypha guttulata TaxID=1690604 RepID=A0ABR0JYK9_9EURO|nr:hypothetical protein LTR24_008911 [Lithohypha guttulata]KAK5322138.1 hypothetical protein LTR70_003985 [Exophiala xenobiotica]